jgi:hypothetical protein
MGRFRAWRHMRWLAVGVAVGVAILVGVLVRSAGSPAPPAPPLRHLRTPAPALAAPAGIQFGASVNLLFNNGTFTPAPITAQLAARRATGATFARSDALWEASEPRPPQDGVHHYDWFFDDTIAADLAQAHLQWLPIIDYSAPWAQSVSGQDHSPPSSDADYAAYAQAFAARYGAGGTFWTANPALPAEPVSTIEVWNEPDNGAAWYPAPNAVDYGALYELTREAIDAIDPSARVIVGGLVDPSTFLPALIRTRPALVGHLDGVAIHPYGTPAMVLTRITNARQTMRALGLGAVPLYVTEFGWTTSPPGAGDYVPAAERPAYLRATLDELGHTDCGVAAASLYTWVSPERDPANSGDWFGISPIGVAGDVVSEDAQAVAAFRAGLQAAAAGGPAVDACG